MDRETMRRSDKEEYQTVRKTRIRKRGFIVLGIIAFISILILYIIFSYRSGLNIAAELLAEAGYEDGFEANIMINEDNPERLDTAIWLQESLAELNIDINIQQVEWGAYLEMTGNGEHDMFVLGWSNPPADPNHLLSTLFHSDMIGTAGNRSFFSNEEFDQLLDEGKRESDTATREQIYKDAQDILIDEAPAIFIRYPENLNAYQSNINGLTIDENNLLDLRNVTRE